MMRQLAIRLLTFCLGLMAIHAQEVPGLEYYLPSGMEYNAEIPTPESVVGHQVGEWHITHDKLVQYMQTLAAVSDRIEIEDRGNTFEDRPLILLKITAPENHNRLEAIRRQHVALTEAGAESLDLDNMPVVVYQGFSVHGNEPSGSNASLAYAYYLAAAQGPEIEDMLRNTVILLDPSFNPDGLQRFAYNLLRHYLLWLVREVSVLIIIGKALYNVRHVEWGGKQFQLRGAARSASVEQKLNEQGRKKER